MDRFLNQATHNEEFHSCLCENFTEKFYDWRITSLFYTAIHYLKALALKKGIDIGQTHHEIELNDNPDRNNCKMRIKKGAWSDYKSLLQEYVQTIKKTVTYNLISEDGPAHDKTFKTEALIDGDSLGIGIGNSKKEAEQNAAKDAYSKMQQ